MFGTHNDYDTYEGEVGFARPNVSYCQRENEVHYNETLYALTLTAYVDGDFDAIWFYANDTSVNKAYDSSNIAYVELDGVKVEMTETYLDNWGGVSVTYYGTYVSPGEHVVKYYLKDPTLVNQFLISNTAGLSWAESIANQVTQLEFPPVVKRLELYLSYYPVNDIIIDYFNLDYVKIHAFGCNFNDLTSEEQAHIESVCPGQPYYCK